MMRKWIATLALRRRRRMFRGYRHLRSCGRLSLIVEIKGALTTTVLRIPGQRVSRLVFGAAVEDGERVVRQYLLHRLAGLPLNRALLLAQDGTGAPVVYPLPRQWRDVIRAHGVPVAGARSAVMWGAYLLAILVYGVAHGIRAGVGDIVALFAPRAEPGAYAHFMALRANNLPQPGADGRSHDIVSWYAEWTGRHLDVDTLTHSVTGAAPRSTNGLRVLPLDDVMPRLSGIGSIGKSVVHQVAAAALAILDLLRGRWWHALLFHEVVQSIRVRAQRPGLIAREYLFHNSGWIFRPLWTYDAVAHGATISFYFYSTNTELFRRGQEPARLTYGWQSMNWPRYLVWDEAQANFIRAAVGSDAGIVLAGPIHFATCSDEVSGLPDRLVSVFDVTPFRASTYVTLGLDREFYVPAVSVPFLHDVSWAVREAGATLAWKQKRDIGREVHPQYRRCLERLLGTPDVVIINPDVAAQRVIETSRCVISMPFTSTALIARALDRPACFYDPTGTLDPGDPAGRGIPILGDREALLAWLRAHIDEVVSERSMP